MKKLLFLLLIPFIGFTQNIDELFLERGELNFSFEYKNKNQLNDISDIVSIDHKTNAERAYAYANKKEFSEFLPAIKSSPPSVVLIAVVKESTSGFSTFGLSDATINACPGAIRSAALVLL